MTHLSVNINKVATLRNARGENNPDIIHVAKLIESYGADGITVHPRPDERHIRRDDVFLLKKNLFKEFNVEGFPSKEFISLMQEIRPEQITLVPDPPDVLTSNAGFLLKKDFSFVYEAIKQLKITQSRISIFIEPKDFIGRDVSIIKDTGCDRIELYTKRYADNRLDKEIVREYVDVAERVHQYGIDINAGHDLSLNNLEPFLTNIPFVKEVSIGHALICDALIMGLKPSVKKYLDIVRRTQS